MYLQRIIMARSRDFLLVLSCLKILIPFCSKTALVWRITVAGNNKTYLGLHVKCPIILSDFYQNFLNRFSYEPPPSIRSVLDDTCGQAVRLTA
jgi:hypothetical protein